jgi:hypothetical protein
VSAQLLHHILGLDYRPEPLPPEGLLPTHLGIGLATGKANRPAKGATRAIKKYLAPLLTTVDHGGARWRFHGCGPVTVGDFRIRRAICRVHVIGPSSRCRAILRVRLERGHYQTFARRLHCRS